LAKLLRREYVMERINSICSNPHRDIQPYLGYVRKLAEYFITNGALRKKSHVDPGDVYLSAIQVAHDVEFELIEGGIFEHLDMIMSQAFIVHEPEFYKEVVLFWRTQTHLRNHDKRLRRPH
jgi:hypothetical protein